jgi:hypothetical protein
MDLICHENLNPKVRYKSTQKIKIGFLEPIQSSVAGIPAMAFLYSGEPKP